MNIHDKFLQSLPISQSVGHSSNATETGCTEPTLQKTVDSTGAVLLEVVDTPANVSTTGASRQACALLGSTVDTRHATTLGLLAEFHIFSPALHLRGEVCRVDASCVFTVFTEKIVIFMSPLYFAVIPDLSGFFEALDDEEFFVIEGSGWQGRRSLDSQATCPKKSQ